MPDTLIYQIEKLIDLGVGDSARLSSMMDQMKRGKQLYSSDQIYLDSLISKHLFPQESENQDNKPEYSERTRDESFTILKNRLARGEITPSEFDILKNKLTENDLVADVKKEIRNVEEKMNEMKEKQSVGQMMQLNMKKESTTLILSIVLGILGFQGIGHLYVGKIGKGVAILIGSFILFVLAIVGITTLIGAVIGVPLLIVYFAIFIWQIVDARNLCKKYNQYLSSHKERPW